MSGHPQLSPYLNRLTTLWQDKADVKLEFTCMVGNVIVNLSHNIGGIVKVPEEVKNPESQFWKCFEEECKPVTDSET